MMAIPIANFNFLFGISLSDPRALDGCGFLRHELSWNNRELPTCGRILLDSAPLLQAKSMPSPGSNRRFYGGNHWGLTGQVAKVTKSSHLSQKRRKSDLIRLTCLNVSGPLARAPA